MKNCLEDLSSIEQTIFSLSKDNTEKSAEAIIKFFSNDYPTSFNFVICHLIYSSFISHVDFDTSLLFIKEIESKEEKIMKTKPNILNIFSQFLLGIETEESNFLLRQLIDKNLIDPIKIRNKKTLYFADYLTKGMLYKLRYAGCPFNYPFFKNIEKLSEDNWKLHKYYIKQGYDTEILKAIRNDDLETLQETSSQIKFDINQKIEPSLYNRHSFINAKNVSLIDYAAFFGSVKCFKYLLMNNANVENTGKYAVAGGNAEIIHLCEQNHSTFEYAYEAAIEFHQNDIFQYLYDNKIGEINKLEVLGEIAIKYGNYEIFSFLESIGMKVNNFIVYEAAKIGNIFLIKYFLEKYGIICNLISAIELGNVELTNFILERKTFSINEKNIFFVLFRVLLWYPIFKFNIWSLFIMFKTPLMIISEKGYFDVFKSLLQQDKIDINAKDDYFLYLKFVLLIRILFIIFGKYLKYLIQHLF